MKIKIINKDRLCYGMTLEAKKLSPVLNMNPIQDAYVVTDGEYKWYIFGEDEIEFVKYDFISIFTLICQILAVIGFGSATIFLIVTAIMEQLKG